MFSVCFSKYLKSLKAEYPCTAIHIALTYFSKLIAICVIPRPLIMLQAEVVYLVKKGLDIRE